MSYYDTNSIILSKHFEKMDRTRSGESVSAQIGKMGVSSRRALKQVGIPK